MVISKINQKINLFSLLVDQIKTCKVIELYADGVFKHQCSDTSE